MTTEQVTLKQRFDKAALDLNAKIHEAFKKDDFDALTALLRIWYSAPIQGAFVCNLKPETRQTQQHPFASPKRDHEGGSTKYVEKLIRNAVLKNSAADIRLIDAFLNWDEAIADGEILHLKQNGKTTKYKDTEHELKIVFYDNIISVPISFGQWAAILATTHGKKDVIVALHELGVNLEFEIEEFANTIVETDRQCYDGQHLYLNKRDLIVRELLQIQSANLGIVAVRNGHRAVLDFFHEIGIYRDIQKYDTRNVPEAHAKGIQAIREALPSLAK